MAVSRRRKYITEIDTENGKRRYVWPSVKNKGEGTPQFLDGTHQARYNTLVELKSILEVMTDAEVEAFIQRRDRLAEAPKLQTSLF